MEKPARANYVGENTGGWTYMASAGWGALGGGVRGFNKLPLGVKTETVTPEKFVRFLQTESPTSIVPQSYSWVEK